MKREILNWIVCPRCAGDFALREDAMGEGGEVLAGRLTCPQGHAFPIRGGIPRLLPSSMLDTSNERDAQAADPKAIAASFGREWSHFDYDTAITWHSNLDERRALFLRETALTAEELQGKLVLDAGCGNGSLSYGIGQYGCDVLAADVSDSVEAAYHYYSQKPDNRVHYIQADLMQPPFRRDTFDVIFSSGVLHHNPNTYAALKAVARALKEGGRIYIWLYSPQPGLKFYLQLKLRSVVSPLPAPLKHAFVLVWSLQSMLRQQLRRLVGYNRPEDRLTLRERIVDLMDIYTPRYRWMHTEDEVKGWYQELGLVGIEKTEEREWGFGVAGTRPLSVAVPS
jgi:SAM-dependent methyltransferase